MSLGKRLRTWRDYLGLSQTGFADLSGVHDVQIKKYETNVSIPGGKVLEKFATTGLNVHWLLTGNGTMCSEEIESPSFSKDLPSSLEKYSDQLGALMNTLAQIDDAKKEILIGDLFKSVQETKRIDDMEKIIFELKNERRTGT